MELNGSSSNAHQKHSSEGSRGASKEKSTEKEIFVNHAEIAWHQTRKEWVGNRSRKLERQPKDSIVSVCETLYIHVMLVNSNLEISCSLTSYEELLLSTEPFQQPISLHEMVDFLVDFWLEEGLYD